MTDYLPGHIIERVAARPRRIYVHANEVRAELNDRTCRLSTQSTYDPDKVLERIRQAGGVINLAQWTEVTDSKPVAGKA